MKTVEIMVSYSRRVSTGRRPKAPYENAEVFASEKIALGDEDWNLGPMGDLAHVEAERAKAFARIRREVDEIADSLRGDGT